MGLVLTAVGCSAPSGPAPCESVYASMCGDRCSLDTQCPRGQYCGADGRCAADCAEGARGCGPDQVCTVFGRCVAGGSARRGGDASAGDASAVGEGCAYVDVSLARQTPTLLLLIDQSGSMTERFGGTTRWDAIRDTLADPATGVVRPLQHEVRFGLALYTSTNGASGGACPLLTPPIAAALDNYDAIAAALRGARPGDDTPTAESVREAARILAADPSPGTKAIVLATDGEPDTCADPDAQSGGARLAMARQMSVDAVRAAFAMGVRTYVVSVGGEVAQSHLQDLADAGAGASGARYFQALEPAALTEAFRAITSGARSCVFDVRGRIVEAEAARGDVRLDGAALPYNDPDGWRLRSPSQIELVGAACARARAGASTLSARFPCEGVTPG